MNHNAIFINNYGAGKASIVKLNEQAYNQFTSPQDTEFVKFKKAYADGKLGVMPTPGYSAGVGISLAKYPTRGDEVLSIDDEIEEANKLAKMYNRTSPYSGCASANASGTPKFSSDVFDFDEERRQVSELQRRNVVSDPEGLYSFAAENRMTDASLEKVAIDPTFIENLFLSTKNASQHTDKYNIESYIVHDSAGRTDYVLMYNKSTGKAGISPLGIFYGLRLRVTELDEARFREMVKNYGGAVEAEHKALLSIADGGHTSYEDDNDESVGEISTTIGKLPNSRMLVSLRSTKNTGTMLYAGDYYRYFSIDRESFINNGYYEYIKNTPYMYTPDDFGDTVDLFKDAFYMFTDGEIDWNVLTELLKKLPEDVRIRVPGPFSTGGSFWKIGTVGLVNGRLKRI